MQRAVKNNCTFLIYMATNNGKYFFSRNMI